MSEESGNDLVRVVFRVKKHCLEPKSDELKIFGDIPELGNWNTDSAPKLNFIGYSEWQLELWLAKDSTIHFKLFCTNPQTNQVFNIEDEPIRELKVKDESMYVELEYNRASVVNTRPMASRLTSSGGPFVLPRTTLDTEKYSPTAGDWDMEEYIDDSHYCRPELYTSCDKVLVHVKMPPKLFRYNDPKTGNSTLEMAEYNGIHSEKPFDMSPKTDAIVSESGVDISSAEAATDCQTLEKHFNSALNMTSNNDDTESFNPLKLEELVKSALFGNVKVSERPRKPRHLKV